MNRLTMVAVTGVLGLVLSACGDNNSKPTVVVPPDNKSTVVVPADNDNRSTVVTPADSKTD